jgi:hypothetical protein
MATYEPGEKAPDPDELTEVGPRGGKVEDGRALNKQGETIPSTPRAGNESKRTNKLLEGILKIKDSGWAVLIAVAMASFGIGWGFSQWTVVDRRDQRISQLEKENADLKAKVGTASDSTVVLPPTLVAEHHAVTTRDGECQIRVDTAGDVVSRISVILGTAAPVELNVVPGDRKVVGPYYIDILANNFTNLEIMVSKHVAANGQK